MPVPPPQESPRTVGIAFLIVFGMFTVVGSIMHFSGEPLLPEPAATVLSPLTSSQRTDTPNPGKSRPPVSASSPPATHAHSLPMRLAKLHPEFVTETASLDRRFSADERRQLYLQLQQEQSAVQTEIHLDYENLPPSDNPEENVQRSAEEGQKIVDAQSNVYDTLQKENRLTDGQMSSLIEEGQDNHWDQEAATPQ